MSNLIDALILKYQGEVEVARANIDVLLNNPTGVADHPDMAETLDGLVKHNGSVMDKSGYDSILGKNIFKGKINFLKHPYLILKESPALIALKS